MWLPDTPQDHDNRMIEVGKAEPLRERITELEAQIADIHASQRRLTFTVETYLQGLRYAPGEYVLMRIGDVPDKGEPPF
jgi:hypothetical protein